MSPVFPRSGRSPRARHVLPARPERTSFGASAWHRGLAGVLVALGVGLAAATLLAMTPSTPGPRWAEGEEGEGAAAPAAAAAAAAPGIPGASRVVLVLVDAIPLGNIDPALAPHLWRLASSGAVGLMNVRTAKTLQDDHTYVTLGAGTRAQGPPETGHAFNSDETVEGVPAAVAFARNTGATAPPRGAVVHPYIALINEVNSGLSYHVVPGALGEALKLAGKRTAVFGNSDTPGHPGRHAVAIAMDSSGLVDLGDVGQDTVKHVDDFPGGMMTDIEVVARLVKDTMTAGRADFVVVESGNMSRVERYLGAGLLTDAAYEKASRSALASADALVGRLLEFVDLTDTVFVVLSPSPAAREIARGRSLAPVIAAGPTLSTGSGGLLTSATTRRDGLITNTDVAASVMAWLGVTPPPWVLGAPVRAVADPAALRRLRALHDEIASTYLVRAPILKAFVGFQIIVALVSLGLIAFFAARSKPLLRQRGGAAPETPLPPPDDSRPNHASPGRGAIRTAVRWAHATAGATQALLLCLGTVPLAMLFLPSAVHTGGGASAGALVAAAALAMYVFARAVRGRGAPPGLFAFAVVYLLTGLAVTCDALLGSPLMQRSVLGYDPVAGARFYGIGNEYMGVLVGSLITGTGLAVDRAGSPEAPSSATRARRAPVLACTAVLFALGLVVLASPSFGANMGGTLTAVAGFGVAYALYSGRRVTGRRIAALAGLGAALVAGIAIADALRAGGPTSHWGRAILAVSAEGPGALADIVRRKAAMNLKLIRYTVWTRALLAFLAAVALLWVRPVGLAKKLMKANPGFASALGASLFSAGVAIVTNDSGVVAAALLMMYPSLVLLYLACREAADGA